MALWPMAMAHNMFRKGTGVQARFPQVQCHRHQVRHLLANSSTKIQGGPGSNPGPPEQNGGFNGGSPKNGGFSVKNPVQVDDLEVANILGNLQIGWLMDGYSTYDNGFDQSLCEEENTLRYTD